MVEQIDKLLGQCNENTSPLLDFIYNHIDDPFFDTEDGLSIIKYANELMDGLCGIKRKLILITLQNVIIDNQIEKDESEEG